MAPAKITWYHNCTLLDKVKDVVERRWYIAQTLEHGWTRDVLVHQIESGLHERQGRAITNFQSTLPKAQSELAQQILKDPYNFDFLSLGPNALERDLEKALLEKLRDFLLELGSGFSFVGSQYHLEVGGQDYYLDLLFYHLRMRCFVVVDLKITDFIPEYAGKMGFYLAAVDDQLRHSDDKPTIGLILCKTNNRIIAEYTLRNSQNPMGVSEYRLAQALPEAIGRELPPIEKLDHELGNRFVIGKSAINGPDKIN
jgi:predicted nuclease of restriction endonuclease-like (RecB) superfamily